MWPERLILVIGCGCFIVWLFDEYVIVPEAKGNACEFFCESANVGVKCEVTDGFVFWPEVDELGKDGVVTNLYIIAFIGACVFAEVLNCIVKF